MKIVFDFDGTLVDSMPKLRALATELISSGYDIPLEEADELYMLTVGRSFKRQLDVMFPQHGANEEITNLFYTKQESCYVNTRLHAGVLETIDFLNATPFRYGVCSSTHGAIVHEVIRGLIPEFKGTATGSDYGTKRSQLASHFKHIDTPSRWFIGDAPYDCDVSGGAGANFVGVTHTFSREKFHFPDLIVGSIPEAVDKVMRRLKEPLQLSLVDRQPIKLPASQRSLEDTRSDS